MELTTHFGLHSQATRLRDDDVPRPLQLASRGLTPTTGRPIQRYTCQSGTLRVAAETPHCTAAEGPRASALGFSPFARRYSGNPS